MKRIGMRNIKTAMAVTISVFLSQSFGLDSPFYAAIAAVISMQTSVTGSYTAGKNRMLGTMTGATVGLCISSIEQNNPLLCGLGIIIVIYILNSLKWKKSVTIGCIVFIGIMVNLTVKTPLYYSVHRVLDTFIGITVAVIINVTIRPPRHEVKVKSNLNSILNDLYKSLASKIYNHNNINIKKLKKQINSLEGSFNTYVKEFNTKGTLDSTSIKNIISILNSTLIHLSFINSIHSQCKLSSANYETIKTMYDFKDKDYEYKENELNTVYNYHVKKVLLYLKELKKISI